MHARLQNRLAASVYADLISRIPEAGDKTVWCGPGWKHTLDALVADLDKIFSSSCGHQSGPHWFPIEVKEKFGTLRFYFEVAECCDEREDIFEAALKVVHAAEAVSGATCEKCGASAALRKVEGNLSTLCDDCYSILLAVLPHLKISP